ncbi:MAG: enoyl-CoA hydratase-related protein [Firmicutes bacterium]|nr:enoyl-CoA hydratase-related protein [Bacillota bacterium]MDH7496575.1 enoyl-CoA hydratase-related protein [Bacillota bacterium]
MEGECVKLTRSGREEGIAIVTIDRPPVNALDLRTVDELDRMFSRLTLDEALKVVIVTGAGDRAFAAGADVREFPGLTREAAIEMSRRGHAVMNRISSFPRPVIAAVNGACLGGGCELAMACDVRIASDAATFGQPEVNLGLIPGYGGTIRLPRLVGPAAAKELLFTGGTIDAHRALAIGLVNRVVPHSDLMQVCIELARTMASKAPIAVRLAKTMVNEGADARLEDSLDMEARLFGDACATEDMREGVQAFLEKRKPKFAGR